MDYNWRKQQPYAFWLGCVEGLGNRSKCELIEYAGSPQAVYEMNAAELKGLLPNSKLKKLEEARKQDVMEQYARFERGNIRFIPREHPEYPLRLKQIPDPPYGIFVCGGLPEDERPAVAIIGARQCSAYGKYMAEKCGRELAEKGVAVISGMARGIDGIGHLAALEAGGKTYAVLGCGVDVCYPAENRRIYDALRLRGGILSEYLPGTQPKAGLFPRRNRIISGLADVVLIVEAREKSGTLITADMALEQGKDIYVIPGRVTDPLSEGCNRLVKQGAGLMLSVSEMMKETGLDRNVVYKDTKEKKNGEAENKTGKIMDYLDYYPKSAECLQRETGMEYKTLICELMKLCMDNKAVQISAGQYIRK